MCANGDVRARRILQIGMTWRTDSGANENRAPVDGKAAPESAAILAGSALAGTVGVRASAGVGLRAHAADGAKAVDAGTLVGASDVCVTAG